MMDALQKVAPTKYVAGVVGVGLIGVFGLMQWLAGRKRAALKREEDAMKPNVVYLYVFPRWALGPGMSSPCTKVETFLRLAHIPYVVRFLSSPASSPTGRLPYICLNHVCVSDSNDIIQHLSVAFEKDLEASLTAEQRALSLAIRRMCDDHMYFSLMRLMWVDSTEYSFNLLKGAFKGLPVRIARIIFSILHKKSINVLNTQGTGDRTTPQYQEDFLKDIVALEHILGDKPFLLGGRSVGGRLLRIQLPSCSRPRRLRLPRRHPCAGEPQSSALRIEATEAGLP